MAVNYFSQQQQQQQQQDGWNEEKKLIFDKYNYNTFVSNVRSRDARLDRAEILRVEKNTRGQSQNVLWNALRMDRQTASSSSSSNGNAEPLRKTAAMAFGLEQEQSVKLNALLMQELWDLVDQAVRPARVVRSVLDCGLFFSRYGLNSASPDAYFVTSDDVWVPVEIKCPFSYRDTTVAQMRSALGVRKNRYRVKHTALSVNVNGPPVFAVEKTDPHYRQMQRQMYVLDAPVCIYLVKFKDSHVSVAVARDQPFCSKEEDTERRVLAMHANKNSQRDRMKVAAHRTASLAAAARSDPAFQPTAQRIEALAANGLYYDFGYLMCVYCHSKFETSISDSKLQLEHTCCSSSSQPPSAASTQSGFRTPQFSDHSLRIKSLLKHGACLNLARQGLFCNDKGEPQLFCCNGRATGTVVEHAPACNYVKMLAEYGAPVVPIAAVV
uniref:Alkaline exonuclease n=1 Tax=Lymantria dispar multicapsid nuclear polyhedrosis virus TaxID=10449 RepID=A0A1B1MR57_NPVLD|nr:alkaline exonuclease [Lymantria dispar multiple nucleopolyhedrovirus]